MSVMMIFGIKQMAELTAVERKVVLPGRMKINQLLVLMVNLFK
jgi:hypothetical protein